MKKSIGIIVYALLVVLVLLGVIGGVIYLTNGGTTNIRTFNILLDGELIDNQVVSMRDDNTPIVFEVNSLIKDKMSTVTVRAEPNNNADLVSVTAGDNPYRLSDCKDLSSLFNINYDGNTIIISSVFDFSTYLADYFQAKSAVVSGLNYGKENYITLIFSAGKTEIKCSILNLVSAKSVELDTESIVIGG